MWDVILCILSFIGIILLALLVFLFVILLLVLFYPITYRIRGQRTPEETRLLAKINWLFGLVRLRYAYPEPGSIVVKLLWKTVFDSGVKTENKPEKNKSGKKEPENSVGTNTARGENAAQEPDREENRGMPDAEDTLSSIGKVPQESETREKADTESREKGTEEGTEENTEEGAEEGTEEGTVKENKGVFGKINKIKYTIQRIYDKMKEIWENLSYYTELLQEEETSRLWKHVKLRMGRVLKSIRPRHIRADILFGTGSPDTTGYVFGVYGMLSQQLGPNVSVTPDFTQAILQGEADVSGHITVFVLAVNALKLFFDRNLHLFLKKLKRNDKSSKHAK